MKNMRRCPACGCRRKPSHEKRCGTKLANSPDCIPFKEFDYVAWKEKMQFETKAFLNYVDVGVDALKDARPIDMGGTITNGDPKVFFAGDKV